MNERDHDLPRNNILMCLRKTGVIIDLLTRLCLNDLLLIDHFVNEGNLILKNWTEGKSIVKLEIFMA